MKAIGYILIFIAIVNCIALVGGLFGNAPNSFINSKITCVLAFGGTASLILYLQDKKEKKNIPSLRKEDNKPLDATANFTDSDESPYSTFIVDNYLQKHRKSSSRPSIKTRNEIPVIKMMKTESDGISFIENPKTGKIVFKCGNIRGFVYPKIQDNIMNVDINTLAIQEISINNIEYIPTIVPLRKPLSVYVVSKENLEDVKFLMTASELEQKEGEFIQYIKYPESERLNFYCGCVEGIVHPDLEKSYASASKEDILYVEYTFDGKTYSMLEHNDKSSTKRFINIVKSEPKAKTTTFIEGHSNDRLKSPNIKLSNKMSAKELIIRENATIDFLRHPKTGKIYFKCGNVEGFVTPSLQEKIDIVELDEIQYADVSIDGGKAMPTLMFINKPIVERTMGLADIEDLP